MNRIKIASAAIVLAAGTIGAFAFTNNGEKELIKEEVATFYYAVDSESGGNYQIHEIPMPSGECPDGADACEFSSPNQLGTSVSKPDVDTQQNGIILLGQQDL